MRSVQADDSMQNMKCPHFYMQACNKARQNGLHTSPHASLQSGKKKCSPRLSACKPAIQQEIANNMTWKSLLLIHSFCPRVVLQVVVKQVCVLVQHAGVPWVASDCILIALSSPVKVSSHSLQKGSKIVLKSWYIGKELGSSYEEVLCAALVDSKTYVRRLFRKPRPAEHLHASM